MNSFEFGHTSIVNLINSQAGLELVLKV